MSSPCTISVLLTAHNCEKYISDTLESLKRACHSVQNTIEFVLVNDASTDNTSHYLHAFAAENAYVKVLDVDFRNIGKVRNFGITQCSGNYITMLDGDDQLLGDSFAEIVDCLNNEKPDLLLAPLNEVYESKKRPEKWHGLKKQFLTQHQTIEKFLIHKELQAHFIGQFIKREILQKNKFPEFICYEDAYLFPSVLVSSDKILFAEQSPYLYFKRTQSLSNALDMEKISLLIKATERMDEVLDFRYKNLISCHWINIAHKFYPMLKDEHDRSIVSKSIQRISFFSFLGDTKVRASFKKKYLKIKLKSN